ncbi:ATP-binding protein [Methanobrevibacter curvatus]|uniref:Putative AAA-ATPase n=1 Tax=Methanobrevibacter curvatus TaxID=49547 RepID=A0A165Z254_9EURY|nr:ATP-binding protein [Methanobrevibacter curvatus]KZX10153.1 putative AAA-ATPase [Methanobrevibacter curvatus]
MKTNHRKLLSFDVSDFDKLISQNKIYVDKTKFIKQMIDEEGTYYFLSRPRRFGKTLFLSTLKNFFKGNKKLFESLYIYDNWDWNEKYPVIHLDMSKLESKNDDLLELTLTDYINIYAEEYNIELNRELPISFNFFQLIRKIHNSTNKKVVVLIDEYDAPILDNINNVEIADNNRKFLQNFYNVLKNSEEYLRFVFITGISKFAKTSIFSKLNNLIEITLDPKYSTICGITHKELEYYYKDQIQALSTKLNCSYKETLNKINFFYDGYSWDGETKVFNPYSTILAFRSQEFIPYWFESGTPSFLTEILKNRKNTIDYFKPILLSRRELNDINPLKANVTGLLFQSGYLTIDKKIIEGGDINYFLKIPNFEVESAYKENLKELFIEEIEDEFQNLINEFWDEIINGGCKKLSQELETSIARIPYYLKPSKNNREKWKFYSIIFTTWAQSMGFQVTEEKAIQSGRIDFTLENREKKYLIIAEMKYTQVESKSLDTLIKDSFKQIQKKKYWRPYRGYEIRLMALGLKDTEIDDVVFTDVKCKILNVDKTKDFSSN